MRPLRWFLVAVLTVSCGHDEAPATPTIDLIAELPGALVVSETRLLDIGAPEARPRLVSGWWASDEIEPRSGRTFVWGIDDTSTLSFEVVVPRDLEVTLRGRLPSRLATSMPMTVAVNGEHAAVVELDNGFQEAIVRLPARHLVEGENRLTLGYELPDGGRDAERRGGSTLALAWYEVAFGGASATPVPEPRVRNGALVLPLGARLDYHFPLPPGTRFAVDDVRSRGGEAVLDVRIATDADPTLRTLELDADGTALANGSDATEIVRLTLQAKPVGDLVEAATLVIAGATLRMPFPGTADPAEPTERSPSRPNILVYLVDTLRTDSLGAYGGRSELSPHIDRFADTATVFESSVAQSSFTRSSVASAFTGLWPLAHGVASSRARLPEEATTLAELLQAAGYRTVGFVANGTVAPVFGFGQGFDDYSYRNVRADGITDLAGEWLESRDRETPFFLYVHTLDPHTPYDPPAAFRERIAGRVPPDFPLQPEPRDPVTEETIAHFRALYDGEVAFNDVHFGRLLELLRRDATLDDTLVVFLSDHGEEFQEHNGWRHHRTLHAESIGTPLIVKMPGQTEGRRVTALAQHVDLLPTLLDTLGLAPQADLAGRSLLRYLRNDAPPTSPERHPAFGYLMSQSGRIRTSVIEGRWKLLEWHRRDGTIRSALYDIEADPGETRNLVARRPIVAGYLASLLRRKVNEGYRLQVEDAVLTEEIEEDLKALGYL